MGFVRRTLTVLSFLALGLVPAGAEEVPAFQGETWIRQFPLPAQPWRNSHYRMEIWSFHAPREGGGPVVHVQLYPDARTRTLLRLGTGSLATPPAAGEAEGSPTVRLGFRIDRKATALRMDKAEGFPVSTFLKVSGLVKAEGEESLLLEGLGPDARGIRRLRINGQDYANLKDLVVDLARRKADMETARQFTRIFFIQVLTHEARIKDFGSNAMIDLKLRLPGLSDSWLDLAFESRGFLGSGNSGVLFTLNQTSDFPDLVMGGTLYAGAMSNEGTMTMSVREGGRLVLLGSVDSSRIKLEGGVASRGVYLVRTAVMGATEAPLEIPFDAVGE